MFTMGARYDLHLISGYADDGTAHMQHHYDCEVIGIDGPVVRLRVGNGELVVNTASPMFTHATTPPV